MKYEKYYIANVLWSRCHVFIINKILKILESWKRVPSAHLPVEIGLVRNCLNLTKTFTKRNSKSQNFAKLIWTAFDDQNNIIRKTFLVENSNFFTL